MGDHVPSREPLGRAIDVLRILQVQRRPRLCHVDHLSPRSG